MSGKKKNMRNKIKKSGGVRKKVNSRKAKKVNASEKDKKAFSQLIDKMNESLKSYVDERELYFAHNHIEQYINIIYCNLRVFSIRNKSKTIRNVSHMRREWDFVYKHIFNEGRFKKNSKFYKNNFEEGGYKYILACYDGLYDDLLSRVFLHELKNYQAPSETDFKMQMVRMGFMEKELKDVSREELYTAYRQKTLLYHPDRAEARDYPERYKIHYERTKRAFIMLDMIKNRDVYLIKYPEENYELQKIIENMGFESDEENTENTENTKTNLENINNKNNTNTTNVGDMSVFKDFNKHFGTDFLKQVSSTNSTSNVDGVSVEVLDR